MFFFVIYLKNETYKIATLMGTKIDLIAIGSYLIYSKTHLLTENKAHVSSSPYINGQN